MLSSSPGVPTFMNESLRKTAMQNAITFRSQLEKTIDAIIDENLDRINLEISEQIIKNSKKGFLNFTCCLVISHRNIWIMYKNSGLSIDLLTNKYKKKLEYHNIEIKEFNQDEHHILIDIKIE
jgi:hypothetical protein